MIQFVALNHERRGKTRKHITYQFYSEEGKDSPPEIRSWILTNTVVGVDKSLLSLSLSLSRLVLNRIVCNMKSYFAGFNSRMERGALFVISCCTVAGGCGRRRVDGRTDCEWVSDCAKVIIVWHAILGLSNPQRRRLQSNDDGIMMGLFVKHVVQMQLTIKLEPFRMKWSCVFGKWDYCVKVWNYYDLKLGQTYGGSSLNRSFYCVQIDKEKCNCFLLLNYIFN